MIVINHGADPVIIAHGMRIAQMVVAPVARAILRGVEALDDTARAAGGFGSTGTGGCHAEAIWRDRLERQPRDLSPDELARYARHIVLREIGGPGQQRLRSARVLMVGAGGLGCPALLYLAAAGVGTLGIVDDDAVSLSNLQRQILFGTPDIGAPKVESAARALARLNPERGWRRRRSARAGQCRCDRRRAMI